ncbi:MAG: 1-deoxy-D-xylulose-5-phosphate synthase [Alphaproteobacteria bacterium]|nr:1-deoxy-D-xylulose-5-phosphate synthase [Alphaproteobacteria bacterium]
MILDRISKPSDLKNLSIAQLTELCAELRSEIIRITEKNGGHLGSNLGAIELIVAIHYVFDIESDRLIFDVGHQAYAHKLLTGRREMMENLRTEHGASGFPDPVESEYDYFIAGHASTSISAALGMAKARDLDGGDYKVISFLGDGSLSGGMVYEAMNNVAGTKNFIVILNDNQMSISESVGAMKLYLAKLLASRGGLSVRRLISKSLTFLPKKVSRKIEDCIKALIQGNNIFEEFGFQYVGVLDGHDLAKLIKIFTNIRDVATYKPVLIHAITQKGKGYAEAERDETRMHGIDKSKKYKYSDVFGKTIAQLAEHDEKIVCITAAMKTGTGLSEFSEKFPDRFFDVGIAEEHAVTFAAGLAKQGYKPFVCIYSTFLQRAFDQIYHDVVLQNLPVRFIIDKAGFPGADGKTHAGLYDVSMLQNFPQFIIMAPSGKTELEHMVKFASCDDDAPIAIRFPKAEAHDICPTFEFSLKSRVIAEGHTTLIISVGDMLKTIFDAVAISGKQPTIIDTRFIQPLDFETFYKYAKNHEKIIFISEDVWSGSASLITERLIFDKQQDLYGKIQFICADKISPLHCARMIQLKNTGLSAEDIARQL